MLAALWIRIQPWIAAAGIAVGVVVSAFVVGRRTGDDRVRAQAAADEQDARRKGNAAAADAERTGSSDRLRNGTF